MQTFSLKLNLCIQLRGRVLRLKKRLQNWNLLFEDELGAPIELSEKEFYLAFERREIVVDSHQPYLDKVPLVRNAAPDLSCFRDAHSGEALRRRAYLNQLRDVETGKLPSNEEISGRIDAIASTIQDSKKPPSPSSIRRWNKLYDVFQSVVQLVPQYFKKGRGQTIVGELEDLLELSMGEAYLQLERPTVAHLYENFRWRVNNFNQQRLPSQLLNIPSEMTVRRYLERLDPYQLDCKRLGKYAADKEHRSAVGELRVDTILDRWEIDHTHVDLLLVDPDTGEVIGRPYITVILDRFSRVVMAFWIHLSPPNTESVLMTIERAIRPKKTWLSRFPNAVNDWRAHGLPLSIVPDNAAEFHAHGLIDAFNELGIQVIFPRSRGPQMKGAIERFLGTLSRDLFHRLPGTTFSNTQERGDYPSEELACLTLSKLEGMVTSWIVDCYHQKPHRGLKGRTPAAAWLAGEAKRTPRLPVDLDSLESILSLRATPRLHHYGVEVDCQQYHSPELAELRLRIGQDATVDVRFRDDMGHIWIHDPIRNVFFSVPNKNKRMFGISRDLFKKAKSQVKVSKGDSTNEEQVFLAYRRIFDDVDQARKSNKMRLRRFAAQAKLDKNGKVRAPLVHDVAQPKGFDENSNLNFDKSTPALLIRPRSA
ncbi:MAG: DDE-type integrase/transposase/recombinase [Proteobacteria bacterium]|nr:DDE-type integrase/transposase/recombinase [Pseudomonadota bacterium]